MENTLSKEEIEFVINDSKDQKYKEIDVIHASFLKTHIMKISCKGNLILLYGNDDTGFVHINERHSASSLKPIWNKDKKLQNKSKFQKSIIPIFHYLDIAEQIYKESYLNTDKNKSPEIMDLYEGEANVNGILQTYRLLLYKNTKIIHNLFPTLTEKNKEKMINKEFYRGCISLSTNFLECKQIITIPYKNFSNEMIYRLEIIFDSYQELKTVSLCKFDNGKEIRSVELENEKLNFYPNVLLLLSYQYGDFSKYEKKLENF